MRQFAAFSRSRKRVIVFEFARHVCWQRWRSCNTGLRQRRLHSQVHAAHTLPFTDANGHHYLRFPLPFFFLPVLVVA
jgi:hypothetical protein